MKRGEKPEGYRQARPKTFPASNYSANSQHMLQEIRNSLRNLSRQSDPPKADSGGAVKMPPEDSRQQGRCSNPKHPYHKALQEIRKSLMPFANEPSTSGPEGNKHMSLETPCTGFDEQQSQYGAVIDYSGKVIYQDPMREQKLAANPNSTGLKAPGSSHISQPVLRRPSWKGSKESLAPRHVIVDGVIYRSDSPGPPPSFPPANNQRVNPPLPPQVRSVTPPPNRCAVPNTSSWDPSTKRYSGNMDYLGARISPGPPGAWPDGYQSSAPQNQRGISPVPVGHQPIIMQSSGGNKFTFPPPSWSQNGSAQPDYIPAGSRQPPPPYAVNQSRHSPTDQQSGGPASSPSYANGGNIPTSMMVSNRHSYNLDLYNIGLPQSWAPSQPSGNSSTQDLSPSWQHNVPPRSNSFNNHQLNSRAAHQSSSQPSATTVTAITQAPILQPVKSIPPVPQIAVVAEVPSYQGPPPPYPKHLLQQQAASAPPAYDPGVNKRNSGREEAAEAESSSNDSSRDKTTESATEKEKKQITTSPVPVRRNKRDEEPRGESGRVALYSPQAFKFFMEQHVENILKNHQTRIRRRKQLESEMQRVGLSSEAQEQMRMMLCQKESNYIRLKRAKMDKSMFKRIKMLGIGAFGEVCLARKEDTGALYAMKTLRKKDVLLRNQVAHVKAERDILAEADNEWVVRLYYSFQDRDNLYFVMEYIPGGDMMSLLIRLGIFKEELAQFYIAELTCAVESVHKMGFIHRDIKPDNILIDRDGHIKLTDFGLCTGFRWTHDSKYYQSAPEPLERRKAREHQRCLAHSLVGTPNYIAPEVLLRTGYTQLCDWWSVGVILYEMVVGQPPFLANTPVETQMKVINWKNMLNIPPMAKLSPEASDSHREVVPQPRRDRRLAAAAAPYVPTIAHSTDTSNFDPVDPDKMWSSDSDGEDNLNDTLNGWFRNGKHPRTRLLRVHLPPLLRRQRPPVQLPQAHRVRELRGGRRRSLRPRCPAGSSATEGRDLLYI
ncbi:hypothetical protein JOQ06_009008 [Pogonophryne albipinna]|uniref:non-specific serine/threonine protein kinase n=1 Tax=Pogonophryne albipinna TaxID=1090488 RepID=A0AAD6FVI0_9TELE|nr:hypothetical protein JOQ06_009008 [Pogonophryne albipinna]